MQYMINMPYTAHPKILKHITDSVELPRMKYRFVGTPGYDDKPISTARKSFGRENPVGCSLSGGKANRCVIFPASVTFVAEALERRNKDWIVRTKTATDLIVQVGDSSFHLHKIPLVSKSEYLNRLVFEKKTNQDNQNSVRIRLDNLPGGTETFESIVKFCYGWKVDVTAYNIAALYSAANFLEMSDDLEQNNLISKTEAFLSFVLFSSWKETFQVLRSCESVPSWAKELHILKRCTETIAWKACMDLKTFDFDGLDENNDQELKPGGVVDGSWWFEDVSGLRIDHFIEVIELIKRKGMRSELVGSCIVKWTRKWMSQISFGFHNVKNLTYQLRKVTTESLIRILPEEVNSVSCNFLLRLLKVGLMLKINGELVKKLERRIALMLEQCCVPDLLVKNYGENETVYDIDVVTKVLECYVSCAGRNPTARTFTVGRLVDAYLTFVARDKNLKPKSFGLLAQTLSTSARHCDDNLYQAMDIYLKGHPNITEEERAVVCKAMDYHKLSQEARQHMMKNDRLPTKLRTELILLEQVNMARSVTAAGADFRRTKAQTIIRVSERSENEWMRSRKEIKMMKKEVETMKLQLHQLNMCKIELQKQVKSWH